jgi:putative ABC transport system permease protein
MNRLVVGNLLHRPLRSAISILAVAIEVAMILSIVGILFGQIEGSRRQTSGIGADLIVRPPNASFLTGVSGAPVPAKVAGIISQLPHVAVASPAIQQLSVKTAVETIWGIDYATFNALKPFVFVSGGPFQGPNDVIVDDVFARTGKHYVVGDTIPVLDNPFRICGIVEHGKGGRKFLPIKTLEQEIHARPGMSQYQVSTLAESLSQLTPEHLPAFTDSLYVVIGLAVVVGFIVIFQAMYTAVLERTREIGILKSLGASQAYIVNLVLRETALLSVVGIAVGIGITFVLKAGMDVKFPTIPFPVSLHWIVSATLIALGGALVGASYPALKAARKDPIEALAYE